jgi:hypothetical protein
VLDDSFRELDDGFRVLGDSFRESSMYMVTYQPTSKQRRNPYKLIECFPILFGSTKNYSEQVL